MTPSVYQLTKALIFYGLKGLVVSVVKSQMEFQVFIFCHPAVTSPNLHLAVEIILLLETADD